MAVKGAERLPGICTALGMFVNLRVLQLVEQGCLQGELAVSPVGDLVLIPWLFPGPPRGVRL